MLSTVRLSVRAVSAGFACCLAGAGNAMADYPAEVLADMPVAYWRLGDDGPDATDATGGGSDGVAVDAVTFGEGSLVLPDTDTAVSFAGVGQIASLPFEKTAGGGFTVEFWVKFNSVPSGFVNLVGDGEAGGDFMLMVYAGAGGFIRPHMQTTDGIYSVDSVRRVAFGGVHHVVSTWDEATGELLLYLDGEVAEVTPSAGVLPTTGLPLNTDNPILIGKDNREPTPDAVIDEVAIYDFPLSADRVAAHFAEVDVPDPPDPPDPVAGMGVRVGESSLIGQLDYGDTFTIGEEAVSEARMLYAPQAFPLPAGVEVVESAFGNPEASWPSDGWSIATDAANFPTAGSPYPGTSGAGSDTGFTQRGGGGDWGIPYGLRDVFVVQTDFIQLGDRVDITVGDTPGNIFAAGNLSVFFRRTDHPQYPEIGIYNANVGERDSGLASGIPAAAVGAWVNYAVLVDVPNETLEVFVNEASVGVIDLAVFEGGAYAGLLSNGVVGTGGAGNDRLWSDNFQVGAPGAAAPFLITAIDFDPATALLNLTWNSRPGAVYGVEAASALDSWFELVDSVPSNGTTTSLPDPLDLGVFFPELPANLNFRIRDVTDGP